MTLFNQDNEILTKDGCMAHALGQLERATYDSSDKLEMMARSQVAIGWMMMADRCEREFPHQLDPTQFDPTQAADQ